MIGRLMAWISRRRHETALFNTVQSLLKCLLDRQGKMMGILDDIKVAVADIAKDADDMHDEVRVAVEHIVKRVNMEDDPMLKAALDSMKDSHGKFVASIKELKDKVDEVMASGGPAA